MFLTFKLNFDEDILVFYRTPIALATFYQELGNYFFNLLVTLDSGMLRLKNIVCTNVLKSLNNDNFFYFFQMPVSTMETAMSRAAILA